MTTLEETVVGVLAAMTTPIRSKEFTGICSLKNKRTRPNTKNGIMMRLMSCIRKCNRTRSKVWANILVRNDRPDIKKITTTAPKSRTTLVCITWHFYTGKHTHTTYPTLYSIQLECNRPFCLHLEIAMPVKWQLLNQAKTNTLERQI